MASRGAALPPRSGPRDLAAVAGLIFSIVMVLVVLLFRSAFPPDLFMESTAPPTPDALNRGRWALLLLPYAGIAFIWFMAAVFCLSIATFGRLRKLLPLWLTLLGTLTGLFLLLVPFGVRHIELVFPAWITILSLHLFIKDPGGQPRTQPQTQA